MNLLTVYQGVVRDWKERGFSCDVFEDPPGRRWEGFVHATDELVMVIEGKMEFEIGGTIIHPQPGKEVFIPRGQVHSARNIGEVNSRWLYGYNQ